MPGIATVLDAMLSYTRNYSGIDYAPQFGMDKETNFRREMLYKELMDRIFWCGAEAPKLDIGDVREVLLQILHDVQHVGMQAWAEDNPDV